MKARRRTFSWHSWLGLAGGLWLFVLCLSGAMALFKDDLHAWVAGTLQPVEPLPSVDEAMERFHRSIPPGQVARRLDLPARGRGYELRTKDGQRYRLTADGGVAVDRQAQGIADFLVNYHTRLFMGHAGRWLTGGLGLAFIASMVTGLFLQRRPLQRLLHRRRGQLRAGQADLHQSVGFWGLPFHLLMAATGVWLGLYSLIFPTAAARPAPDDLDRGACAAPPLVSCLLAETRRRIPGFEPVFIDFLNTNTPRARIAVLGNVPGRLVRRDESGAEFDFRTGQLLTLSDPGRMPMSRQIDFAVAPLHFGDFFGGPLRWLYAVLALAGALLSVTGTLMWGLRGPREGRLRREQVLRALASTSAGCATATFSLPTLALLAQSDLGPSFGGSMRLTDLFSAVGAPIVPAFLGLWLAASVGLTRIGTLGRLATASLITCGVLCWTACLTAAALRLDRGLPLMATESPLPPVSASLAIVGGLLVLAGFWPRLRFSSAEGLAGPVVAKEP